MKKVYLIPIIGLLLCATDLPSKKIIRLSWLVSWMLPAAIVLGIAIPRLI